MWLLLYIILLLSIYSKKKDIYNKKSSENEKSENVNNNPNKNKLNTLLSDSLLINQIYNIIAQAIWIDYQQNFFLM